MPQRRPRQSGVFRKSPTALIVEPDHALRHMLRISLQRRADFTVLDTADAHQAVALAQTFRASAVLVEQHLPEVSSKSLLRTLRGSNGTKDAVLAVLADDDGFELPGTQGLIVVPKPFSPVALAHRLAVLSALYAA